MSILKARGYHRTRQETISWLYHFPLGLESLLSAHVSFESDVGHLGASFSATLADLYVEFSINWSFRYVWIYVCAKEAATFALGSVFYTVQ